MQLRRLQAFAVLATTALVGTALVTAPAGAGQAAPGINNKEIVISVLASDVDPLKSAGIIPANSQLSLSNIVRRTQGYADLYGPIHGRKVVVKAAGWNPLDATSFDKACTIATQDNEPFLVINGNGYRADSVACITQQNDTPAFMGESMYGAIQKASGKNLVSIALPAEVNGTAAGFFLDKTESIPKTAKVGIISSNEPQRKAAADSLEKDVKKRGYDIVRRVEINSLQADTTAINRESATAANTLMQAGVDHVLVAISQTSQPGFWQEWGRNNKPFKPFIIDVAGSACTNFAAPRLPAETAGVPCVTTYDTKAVATKDSIKKDSTFEAKCRKEYAQITGWTPYPGAQQGGTNVAGQHWDEDLPKEECTMMSVLLPAIKAAGKNPTWAKVRKNILATTDAPMAYMSGGKGGFAADKPYMADKVHMVTLQLANASTSKDANSTYGGCPLPVNCWVPVLIDGQEWFPAKTGA